MYCTRKLPESRLINEPCEFDICNNASILPLAVMTETWARAQCLYQPVWFSYRDVEQILVVLGSCSMIGTCVSISIPGLMSELSI